MKTRKQMLEWISENPGEVFDDITMLKQELLTQGLVMHQLRHQLKISEFVAGRHEARAERYRQQLNLSEAILINKQI